MTWEVGKSYHCALDIDVDHRDWYQWIKFDGRPVTAYEFEQIRAECKARGYVVFPPCDNVKEDGHCAGHPVVDQARHAGREP